jgi:N-acetylmuramic acid 6-phosphate etherase
LAAKVLDKAAERLAKDSNTCAEKLATEGERVQFVFNGAVLSKNPEFAEDVTRRIEEARPGSLVQQLDRPSVWGAVVMAGRLLGDDATEAVEIPHQPAPWRPVSSAPTEQRNEASAQLDELSTREAIELILGQDAAVPGAVLAEADAIEWTIGKVVDAFRAGGRLIYVGAGTSGRLGVLDASECPPTFRASPEKVQGIIAGGRRALWRAVEGAEDDPRAGAAAVDGRAVTGNDVVLGITASGHAPFVWGALEEAKRRGAAAVLFCCNPAYKDHPLPDCVIAPDTGPEVLTGSTRMKAGTATKLTLNVITTLAMVGVGKVMGNRMIDLNPSNEKLRDRAARIVSELSGASVEIARRVLEDNGWDVRAAVKELKA